MTALDDTGRVVPPPSFPGTFNYSTKRILAIGDSITWGTSDTPPGCAYRDGLSNQMIAAGFSGMQWVGSVQGGQACQLCPLNGLPMFNEGHPGAACNDITALLPSIYAREVPDVTLLMIGTNDLIAVVNGTELLADALTRFDVCFSTMIAQRPDSIFFVANLVPSPALAVPTPTFNANVAAQVSAQAATGTQVYLVDQFSALNPATDFDVGGVHPNAAGYAKMATKWIGSMVTLTP